MRKIAVADCETDPFKWGRIPAPFLWGFYDGETYEEFTDTLDFIAYIIDKPIIIYAHNGGKFDWHFILDFIDPFTDVTIINGRLSKFKIGACEFRDSYNILPTSLSTYQKTEIDYNIFEPEERIKPHNWKKISSYLYDDCRDLYNYVTAFIDRFGMNLTQAGTAMKQWKIISGMEPPKDEGGLIYDYFKRYYYGGRCQSFYHGEYKGQFKMADINSAYPYAMLHRHPISLNFSEIDIDEWEALEEDKKGGCFITLECVADGCFPMRKDSGLLWFPNDLERREYHVTGWEYIAGLETGSIRDIEIKEIYYFYGYISFSDYINHFYTERRKAKEIGDKLGDIFCKLLMNSLYGKFGSNPDNYANFQIVPDDVIDQNGRAGEWEFSGELGPWHLVKKDLEEHEQNFYNVATAASITGFVRAFLWRALSRCDTPLYCDTDSIAAVGINDLPNGIGKELGQWEIEGVFDYGAFGGKKLYAMRYLEDMSGKKKPGDFKIATKGVRISPEELITVAKGGEAIYRPDSPIFSVHKKPHFQSRAVKMTKN